MSTKFRLSNFTYQISIIGRKRFVAIEVLLSLKYLYKYIHKYIHFLVFRFSFEIQTLDFEKERNILKHFMLIIILFITCLKEFIQS